MRNYDDTSAPGDRPYQDSDSGAAQMRGKMGLGKNQDRPRSVPTLPQAAPPPSAAPAAPSAPPTGPVMSSSPTPTGAATEPGSGLQSPQISMDVAQQWMQLAAQPGAPDYVKRAAAIAQKLATGGQQ